MTRPEDALAQARAAAAELRAALSGEDASLPGPPTEVDPATLLGWAVIEADLGEVRSTRPYGAPITALKRGLVRLLYQHHAQLAAQQTRFNVNLLARVRRLEERIDALERERGTGDAPR